MAHTKVRKCANCGNVLYDEKAIVVTENELECCGQKCGHICDAKDQTEPNTLKQAAGKLIIPGW